MSGSSRTRIGERQTHVCRGGNVFREHQREPIVGAERLDCNAFRSVPDPKLAPVGLIINDVTAPRIAETAQKC